MCCTCQWSKFWTVVCSSWYWRTVCQAACDITPDDHDELISNISAPENPTANTEKLICVFTNDGIPTEKLSQVNIGNASVNLRKKTTPPDNTEAKCALSNTHVIPYESGKHVDTMTHVKAAQSDDIIIISDDIIIISDDESVDEENAPVDAPNYDVIARGNESVSNYDMDTATADVPTETKGNMITNSESQDHSVEMEPSDVHTPLSAATIEHIKPDYRHTESHAYREHEFQKDKLGNPIITSELHKPADMVNPSYSESERESSESGVVTRWTRQDPSRSNSPWVASTYKRSASGFSDAKDPTTYQAQPANSVNMTNINSGQDSLESQPSTSGTFKIENNQDQGDSEKDILIANVHTGSLGRLYKCKICPKQFVSRKSLKQHQSAQHRGTVHTCDTCQMSFAMKIDLLKHEMEHRGVVLFECNECEMIFSIRRQLRNHFKRTHPGSICKAYKCPTCGQCFTYQRSLESHQREHTGTVYRETCTVCGKELSRKYLRTHQRICTGVKTYTCTKCDMSFTSRDTWLTHKRIHAGGKPYSCEKCGKSFARRRTLHQHKNRKHPC